MGEILKFITQNSDWLFGSTSVTALVLGVVQAHLNRKGTEGRNRNAIKYISLSVIAVLLVFATSSAYYMFLNNGQDAAVSKHPSDNTKAEQSNAINSGNNSNNIIMDGNGPIIIHSRDAER